MAHGLDRIGRDAAGTLAGILCEHGNRRNRYGESEQTEKIPTHDNLL
jgi:hypothetical protein